MLRTGAVRSAATVGVVSVMESNVRMTPSFWATNTLPAGVNSTSVGAVNPSSIGNASSSSSAGTVVVVVVVVVPPPPPPLGGGHAGRDHDGQQARGDDKESTCRVEASW